MAITKDNIKVRLFGIDRSEGIVCPDGVNVVLPSDADFAFVYRTLRTHFNRLQREDEKYLRGILKSMFHFSNSHLDAHMMGVHAADSKQKKKIAKYSKVKEAMEAENITARAALLAIQEEEKQLNREQRLAQQQIGGWMKLADGWVLRFQVPIAVGEIRQVQKKSGEMQYFKITKILDAKLREETIFLATGDQVTKQEFDTYRMHMSVTETELENLLKLHREGIEEAVR